MHKLLSGGASLQGMTQNFATNYTVTFGANMKQMSAGLPEEAAGPYHKRNFGGVTFMNYSQQVNPGPSLDMGTSNDEIDG